MSGSKDIANRLRLHQGSEHRELAVTCRSRHPTALAWLHQHREKVQSGDALIPQRGPGTAGRIAGFPDGGDSIDKGIKSAPTAARSASHNLPLLPVPPPVPDMVRKLICTSSDYGE